MVVLRIARGGTNWFLTPLVLAIITAGLAGPLGIPELVPLSGIPFFVAMLLLGFFRDPNRSVGTHIVAPADGKVLRMDKIDDPDLGRCDRISIFMGVHNVHVNRMPIDADIRKVTHRPGKHIPAFNKDSDRNERVETLLHGEKGAAKLTQISGAVARRIVPYVKSGDHLHKGDRMGLIRLGSRCDVLFPEGTVEWVVVPKQKTQAGVTSIARWKA